MGRRSIVNRLGLVVALAATSVLTIADLGRAPLAVAVGETGRLALDNPSTRIIDTRSGGQGALAEVAFGIGSGLRRVTIVSGFGNLASVDATAQIHTCGVAPSGAPDLAVSAGKSWSTVTIEGDCLTASADVHVIVDHLGTVSTTPQVGLLQYQSLSAPVQLSADVIGTPTEPFSVNLPRGVGEPATAAALVLAIQVPFVESPGYAVIGSCNSQPSTVDVTFDEPAIGLSYARVSSAIDPLCLSGVGSGEIVVTALGWLEAGGPDPSRLPPTLDGVYIPVPQPGLSPIAPTRVLDTRNDASGKLLPDDVLVLDLIDDIAPVTTAVTMNVTVDQPDDGGFLTVWPCDEPLPVASNLNFAAGETIANLVTVGVADDGTVCIATSATTHVIADLNGTFDFLIGDPVASVTPKRILDTRSGLGWWQGPVAAHGTAVLKVAGRGGVPLDATAVTMNVTATQAQGTGYVTVWPCDEPLPVASNLNYVAGGTIPNLVTVKLAADGTVCLYTDAPAFLIADVNGWYGPDAVNGFVDVAPERILDTRSALGITTAGRVAGDQTVALQVTGRAGVPTADVDAVTMNVTVDQTAAPGFVTVWPCDQPKPEVSNLNFGADDAIPNLVSVKLAADGTVCLSSTAAANLLADVAGYTTATPLIVLVSVVVGA